MNLNHGNVKENKRKESSHRLNFQKEKQRVQTKRPITKFEQSNQSHLWINESKAENLSWFYFTTVLVFFICFSFPLVVCDDIYLRWNWCRNRREWEWKEEDLTETATAMRGYVLYVWLRLMLQLLVLCCGAQSSECFITCGKW